MTRLLQAIGNWAGPLLWAAGVFAGAYAVGRRLLRWGGWAEMDPGARAPLAIGLGGAVLSYAVFLPAALGVLSTAVLWVIFLVWALLAIADAVPLAGRIFLRGVSRPPLFLVLIVGVIAGHALFNLIPALTPAVDWDGVAYHLALPKLYLAAGGFVFRPDIFHNLFPQLTEMLYLAALVFPNGTAAKLVHFGFGLLGAAAVYAAGRQSGMRTGAWLGAAVFYSQFLVHIESGTAFIDLATAAYAGLSWVAFQRWLKPGASAGWLDLALLLAGLAAATKWHGLIWLALIGGLAVVGIWTGSGSAGERFRRLARAMIWGILPVAPYFLRAEVLGGNPVWPLAYPLFGGKFWDAGMARQTAAAVREFAGLEHGWTGLWRLPYDLIVHGDRFGVGGRELRWPLAGAAFLAAARWIWRPARPLSSARPRWGLWGAAAAAGFVGVWFFSSPQARFLIPMFPFAAWLAARGMTDLWAQGKSLPRIAAVAAGLCLFAVHPPMHRETLEQVRVLLGRISQADYVARRLEHDPACRYLNEQVRPGEQVLLFGENRGFYLDVPYLWGDPLLQKVVDYRTLDTPEKLRERLRDLKVNWVLYRDDLFDEDYFGPSRALMDALLAARGEIRFTHGPVKVYSLK